MQAEPSAAVKEFNGGAENLSPLRRRTVGKSVSSRLVNRLVLFTDDRDQASQTAASIIGLLGLQYADDLVSWARCETHSLPQTTCLARVVAKGFYAAPSHPRLPAQPLCIPSSIELQE